MLLSSETITRVHILYIVKVLFSMIAPKEVLKLLSNCHPNHRNEWLFAYYHEIPQCFINQEELDRLYEFLMDESDRNIQSCSCRDIDFLNKYLSVDDNVIITATKIILKKKEYSPFMVNIYFDSQFDERHIRPNDVVQKYVRDIKLLEEIYLCVVEKGQFVDYSGDFLHELFITDKSFIKEYSRWFVKMVENDSFGEDATIGEVFYQEENYIDILDDLVEESILISTLPTITVPRLMKMLLISPDGNRDQYEKCDRWINHFIKNNYLDKNKIQFVFEALNEDSIERSTNYIGLLVNCTEDYDIFESIPLTPLSYSWSGSSVPMYSSWIDHFEKLLPFFSGLKYIKHKNRVQQLIEYYRNRIKEEEISDIIEG